MAAFWHALIDPRVTSHLIADEGEIIIDEVRRHPMAFVLPILITVLGVLIMILTFVVPVQIAWIPLALGLLLIITGGYKVLAAHMDRFVITNMRVFRVNGIFSQHTATMPMSRILDISVHKPLIGRIFAYGHFVFESAAQDQGLRDIRYVGHPDERDLTIQRVIQRSGLRSSMRPLHESDDRRRSRDRRGDDHDGDDYDPTDGSPSADDDAAWLAEGWSEDGSGDSWRPESWTDRDQAEHDQARRHVEESEVGTRTRLSKRFGLSGPPEPATPPGPSGTGRSTRAVSAASAVRPTSAATPESSDSSQTPMSAASSDPAEGDDPSTTGRS
ncbi:MAG TPA: PH domain-containing protein [Microlunatus sp.]